MALLFNSEEIRRHLPAQYKDTEPGWAEFGTRQREVDHRVSKNWQHVPDLRKGLPCLLEKAPTGP